MQLPEQSDEEQPSTTTTSSNIQTGSDLMRKMKKSKTSKNDDNLTHKLIDIERQEAKEEEEIRVLENRSFNFCHFISSSFCSCYNSGVVQSDFAGNNLVCCRGHIISGPLSQFSTLSLTLVLILLPLYGYYWMIHKIYYIELNYIV
eukprot:52587_1